MAKRATKKATRKPAAKRELIAPRGETLRIGRGARIGAGAIVTESVPDGATVVSPPARVLLRDAEGADAQTSGAEIGFREHPPVTAAEY